MRAAWFIKVICGTHVTCVRLDIVSMRRATDEDRGQKMQVNYRKAQDGTNKRETVSASSTYVVGTLQGVCLLRGRGYGLHAILASSHHR